MSQLHCSVTRAVNKFLIAYVILFKRVIFVNISSACVKEYLIATNKVLT